MRNSIRTQFLDERACKHALSIIIPELNGERRVDRDIDYSIQGIECSLFHIRGLDIIKQSVEKFASKVFEKELITNDYWLSISEPSQIVVKHNHLDGELINIASAVLYLQADANSGNLSLETYNEVIKCTTGELVLFDAACEHSVDVNMSDRPRICIAFDMRI